MSTSHLAAHLALVVVTGLSLVACGDDASSALDAGRLDAGPIDAAQLDAGPIDAAPDAGRLDAGPIDAARLDAGLPSTCEGSCRDLTLALELEGETGAFDRAFYGLTAPSESTSGEWELHVEAHAGGSATCPTESSPSPRQTLIITGTPIPQTSADTSATVTLLDFEGRFLDGRPILGATEASVRFVAANVCAECVGRPAPSHPEGLVAFDLAAAFEGGEAAGRVVATHCDSMDLGAP